MRMTLRYLTPLIAAGALAAFVAAPTAAAEPTETETSTSTLPECVDTGGSAALGGSTTQCATPGNVQINATPAEPEFTGPWGDMWGEPGLFFP